jgi:hypothetical protein
MRKLLGLGALVTLVLAGCSNGGSSLTGPDDPEPSFSCAGQSGNCGGGGHKNNPNNNPNNPPSTAP